MGTIKIGSSANRKGITVEPSVVLFNGSNVKKIMSGLVTIWVNIKPLVPTMTSNTTPYGEVSASSVNATTYDAWKAFDNDDTTYWLTAGSQTSAWINYKFINPARVEKVKILNHAYVHDYKIQGSNDNSTWDDLSDVITPVANAEKEITLDNSNYYLYYRVFFPTTSATVFGLKEVQFYGL